jgi:signal transduction histidine kinase
MDIYQNERNDMNNLVKPAVKTGIHPREEERMKSLESFGILDTLPEEDFDELTTIASQICGTPLSFINLIEKDRQWSKSGFGAKINEIPRERAFCSHTILQEDSLMIVEDTEKDDRFRHHPFIVENSHIRFYAGAQLLTEDKLPLGTLCVLDREPRRLSDGQLKALQALSNQVMQLLNLRQKALDYERTIQELKQKNEVLSMFAHVAAHDIKSPLNNIFSLASLFENKYKSKIDSEGQTIINLITVAADNLKNLISGLLDYSTSDNLVRSGKSTFEVIEFLGGIKKYFEGEKKLKLRWETKLTELHTNRTVLEQILLNLISNALEHGYNKSAEVRIKLEEDQNYYRFSVSDNGPGISPDYQPHVFEIFRSFASPGEAGEKNHGIGLATVKKLTELSGGEISLESNVGEGTRFRFSLAKNRSAPL